MNVFQEIKLRMEKKWIKIVSRGKIPLETVVNDKEKTKLQNLLIHLISYATPDISLT